MDETISFGVVGPTGRGVTEHFGINVSTREGLRIFFYCFFMVKCLMVVSVYS
jgi:hypothetical protein